MYHSTIKNPRTGRQNQVVGWDINVEVLWNQIKAGEINAKGISAMLLNDDEAIQEMRDTEYGDDAHTNFGLRVFEAALDWSLGLAVLWFFRACVAKRRKPGPFTVVVNRKGDVFIIGRSGTVYDPLRK